MTATRAVGDGERDWVRLDNSANIFLAARNEVDTKVFRISAELDAPVDPELLQRALDHVFERYPLFRAVLRHGIFWYYLQQSTLRPRVAEDLRPTVTHIYRSDSRELLFRVLYRGNRISLEVFHALTDGTGALWFLEDLLVTYVALQYPAEAQPPPGAGEVRQEFTVDAFTHWFKAKRRRLSFADQAAPAVESAAVAEPPRPAPQQRRRVPGRRVVRVHGEKTPDLRSRVVELAVPVEPVLALARAEGVSLTTLLAGIFLESFRAVRTPRRREDTMAISVPVNLRQFFPTDSGRNFFATTRLLHTYRPDDEPWTGLGEVCRDLSGQLGRQLTREDLKAKMHRLVAFERHPVLRLFPRPVKDWVLAAVNWFNNRGITLAMSNLGRVTLPAPAATHVRGLFFHVSAARPQLCAISHGELLTITISSPFLETDHHEAMVRFLTGHGIDVRVDATRVTKDEIASAPEAAP